MKTNQFVEHWTQQIKLGKRYRKLFSRSEKWDEYRKMYRADWKGNIVPVNVTFSTGRSMIPNVYFRAPRVTVTATNPKDVWTAKVVESVDNWLIRELMLKATLKGASLSAYLTGIGPIKLGFDSEYGFQPEQIVDSDSSTLTQISRKSGRRIEYKSYVKSGMPWALPVMPDDVIVPYGYQNSNSLPWITHQILRPLKDVQEDQKYRNTSKLKGTRMSEIDDLRKKFLHPSLTGSDDIVYAELYETRSVSDQEVFVICEDQLLMRDLDALQIEGLPWEFIIFNEDPEHFWPIADVTMIKPHQEELNDIRTQASSHRKIALIKFLYLKGAISTDQLERLLSSDVGPAVGIDGESLSNAVMPLQPHIPPDFYPEEAAAKANIRETVGYSENEFGAYKQGTPPTATESTRRAGFSDLRNSDRRDIVADVLVNIIRKWNQFIFTFWTNERVAQIVGPQGYNMWVSYTGDQIKGEYNFVVDPDSGFPVTQMLRHDIATGLFKQYNGDALIDQYRLRILHLQNYEWCFPGISSLVIGQGGPDAQMQGLLRQPNPGGGGAGTRGQISGNRGGGRSGLNPAPLQKLLAQGGQ